jgi:predicted dehydrogenase
MMERRFMVNKIIKVLLLGAAFSADLHMDGYSRSSDKAKVVAICDTNPERAKNLADKYGITDYTVYTNIKEAVEKTDCDMVDICLPNFLHCEAALLALDKGKNIICEKPLSTTVEDAQKIVDTAAKAGLHIYYAEDWLFAPAIRKALSIVEDGAIGRTLYTRARECHSGSHSPFAQSIAYCGGGCMVHLGVHPVSFMLAQKNNEWSELVAMTSGGGEKNFVHKAMEGEDWSACLIRFLDGTTALLEGNYVTKGGMEDVIDLYGTDGCLHIDLNFTGPISCFSIPGVNYVVEKAEINTGWTRPSVDEKYSLGYVDEIGYFIDCCAKGEDARVGLRGVDGLEALKVINYIYQSAREGKKVINPKYSVEKAEV